MRICIIRCRFYFYDKGTSTEKYGVIIIQTKGNRCEQQLIITSGTWCSSCQSVAAILSYQTLFHPASAKEDTGMCICIGILYRTWITDGLSDPVRSYMYQFQLNLFQCLSFVLIKAKRNGTFRT